MKKINNQEIIRFTIILLTIVVTFELFIIFEEVNIINDKTAYINGLLSDKKICNGNLDAVKNDYIKLDEELKKYQEKYGTMENN